MEIAVGFSSLSLSSFAVALTVTALSQVMVTAAAAVVTTTAAVANFP